MIDVKVAMYGIASNLCIEVLVKVNALAAFAITNY
jgi:hypothetical protein